MATIVINIDERSNVLKIMDAIRLLKGVQKVTLEEDVRYPHLDKSIDELRKGKVTRSKTLDELMGNLNS